MDHKSFSRTREWSDRVGGWDLRQYIVNNIQVSDAFVMGKLFCPGFIERTGAVFVDFMFDEVSYEQWVDQTKGDIPAIEKILNHLHLWDVFDPKSDQEYAAVSELTGKIAETWRTSANNAFPGRGFSVEMSDEPEDYGPTIMLYSTTSLIRSQK
jgi:hypothetical protein